MSRKQTRVERELRASRRLQQRFLAMAERIEEFKNAKGTWENLDASELEALTNIEGQLQQLAQKRAGAR